MGSLNAATFRTSLPGGSTALALRKVLVPSPENAEGPEQGMRSLSPAPV